MTNYYEPPHGNASRDTWRNTAFEGLLKDRANFDKVWSTECDKILKGYVFRYGTYFGAFVEAIESAVSKHLVANLGKKIRYFDIHIASRAYEIDETRSRWVRSYRREIGKTYTCRLCMTVLKLLDCHPDLICQRGIPPGYCRTCSYIARRYETFSSDIKSLLSSLVINKCIERACDLCGAGYSLEEDLFTYGYGGRKSVDFLFPNLFAQICPKCFLRAFADYKRGSSKTRLSRLYEFSKYIGSIPTQDFTGQVYLVRDRKSMVGLFKILQKLRSPHGFAEECGSFFAALVHSEILPTGSRRMPIGTHVLAEDGHLCFSLPEKDIDDFLYRNGLAHSKEVSYPGSRLKADWEIFGGQGRVFVEYFGMIKKPDYLSRVNRKTELARNHGIELIPIFPGDDWKGSLLELKRKLSSVNVNLCGKH